MSVGRAGGRGFFAALCAAVMLFGVLLVTPSAARAQIGSARYSSMVIDAGSGSVLEAVNEEEPRHPASLTKLMTLYMLFEALRDRRLAMDEVVPVSYHAASQPPSKLGITPLTRLTVEEALLGLVTKSANDAASALGELLGGDEDRFAQMMTLRARALGMSRTTFRNASGLPDPDMWSTAHDLAILARRIVTDFPSYYGYFSAPSFAFHGRTIFNHDRMLQTYPGADGMKTGYTEASGHNLVTSAQRGGVRLIGVVLGAASNPERDIHMASLLDQGFEQLDVPSLPRTTLVASRRELSLIPTVQAATLTVTLPPRAPAPSAARPPHASAAWAIQVGTFGSERAARQAAGLAQRLADGDARVEQVWLHGRPAWRAQLTGLSAAQAQNACGVRSRARRSACFVVRPDAGQMASR